MGCSTYFLLSHWKIEPGTHGGKLEVPRGWGGEGGSSGEVLKARIFMGKYEAELKGWGESNQKPFHVGAVDVGCVADKGKTLS